MNIDAGFLKLLNEKAGLTVDWKDFVSLYQERKKQRDADPAVRARRAFEQKVNAMMSEES